MSPMPTPALRWQKKSSNDFPYHLTLTDLQIAYHIDKASSKENTATNKQHHCRPARCRLRFLPVHTESSPHDNTRRSVTDEAVALHVAGHTTSSRPPAGSGWWCESQNDNVSIEKIGTLGRRRCRSLVTSKAFADVSHNLHPDGEEQHA